MAVNKSTPETLEAALERLEVNADWLIASHAALLEAAKGAYAMWQWDKSGGGLQTLFSLRAAIDHAEGRAS